MKKADIFAQFHFQRSKSFQFFFNMFCTKKGINTFHSTFVNFSQSLLLQLRLSCFSCVQLSMLANISFHSIDSHITLLIFFCCVWKSFLIWWNFTYLFLLLLPVLWMSNPKINIAKINVLKLSAVLFSEFYSFKP